MADTIEVFKEKARKSKATGDYSWLTDAPFDPRFPNTNQAPNCKQNFVDYFRCTKKYGEDYAPCNYFKRVYQLICPQFLYERWEEQVQEGTYPYKF